MEDDEGKEMTHTWNGFLVLSYRLPGPAGDVCVCVHCAVSLTKDGHKNSMNLWLNVRNEKKTFLLKEKKSFNKRT